MADTGGAVDTGGVLDTGADTATDPDTGPMDGDGDGDGFTVADDCDDDDAAVFPGAGEICEDGVDNDCDDGDATCRAAGSYGLAAAAAKLYSDEAGFDAGRHVDAGDIDGDGIDDVVVATKEADGNEGGAYVVLGPFVGTDTLDGAGYWIRATARQPRLGARSALATWMGTATRTLPSAPRTTRAARGSSSVPFLLP